jgi:hypothetical protein
MNTSALDLVFGSKPEGAIFNPQPPFGIRFDCQKGCISVGEDDVLGKQAVISVIKASRFYGTLGMTTGEWLQLFMIGAAGDTTLPANTITVGYIKTRSLSSFQRQVTKLLADGKNPARGLFLISFDSHTSGQNNYKSVRFGYKERESEAELKQLEQIETLMAGNPRLVDIRPGLQCIDAMSPEEIEFLVSGTTPTPPALAPAAK